MKFVFISCFQCKLCTNLRIYDIHKYLNHCFVYYYLMTNTTIIITSIIAITFILLVTTSYAYAAGVNEFFWSEDDGTAEVFKADAVALTPIQVTSGGFARIDDVEYDPLSAKLWWNNWATGPGNPDRPLEDIYNDNLAGTAQTRLFITNSCDGVSPPSGLTGLVLDPATSTVFYTRGVSYGNCPNGEVSSVTMDGVTQTTLDIDSWHPDGIDLSGGTVYWANPGVNAGPAFGPINNMDTIGGSKSIGQLPHIPGHGRSVVVDAANNLYFYSSHSAAPFGNCGVPCRAVGGGIFVIDLTNVGAGATNVLNDPTTGIPDVELDAANMKIYWTDYVNGQINSASYDAAGNLGAITTELSGLDRPYGLALRLNADPSCTGVVGSETSLWPPNHKFKEISISGATDPDGDPVTITVTGITQDEPTNGLGDGDQSPDGAGVGTSTAEVRAERSGLEDGRVYVISYTADDGFGGSCSGTVEVGVPHDKKDTAIDSSPPDFDSTIP